MDKMKPSSKFFIIFNLVLSISIFTIWILLVVLGVTKGNQNIYFFVICIIFWGATIVCLIVSKVNNNEMQPENTGSQPETSELQIEIIQENIPHCDDNQDYDNNQDQTFYHTYQNIELQPLYIKNYTQTV